MSASAQPVRMIDSLDQMDAMDALLLPIRIQYRDLLRITIDSPMSKAAAALAEELRQRLVALDVVLLRLHIDPSNAG